ncbi:uncharacterized protein LOC107044508 [Diachasma alloeum]|uniref:uncharacterized protein LOC107044508 n=1 Tax=Diachasma alloeum TaxID=454923 RepID=UPI0007381571|nr:uncharacterized protein LOC107044508 [Diachasma alloeum]
MRCKSKPKMNEDEAACTSKLGNEPPKPEFDGLVIGEDLAKRLQTGKIDEERNVNYDNYWDEKLSCMDHAHTDRLSLTIDDAEACIKNIQKYLRMTEPKTSPINYNKVANCVEMNKGQVLACSDEVQNFISTVDKLQFQLVRINPEEIFKPNRKMSYAEKFNRKY